jgi:hypothetical protein
MNGNQILSIIGLIVIVSGMFCPIAVDPAAGSLTFFGDGKGNGAIALAIAAVTLICVFINGDKASLLLATINLSFFASVLIGSQFSGSGSAPLQLQWGWALLFIGSIMVLYGASEKNFVVVIGCFVAAALLSAALGYFNYYTQQENLRNKSLKDCETLAAAAQKYYEAEAREIETLGELDEKYIKSVNELKDSWGNSYQYDNITKKIYSKGPDAKAKTTDDIGVYVRVR